MRALPSAVPSREYPKRKRRPEGRLLLFNVGSYLRPLLDLLRALLPLLLLDREEELRLGLADGRLLLLRFTVPREELDERLGAVRALWREELRLGLAVLRLRELLCERVLCCERLGLL